MASSMEGYQKQIKQAVQVDFRCSSGIAIAGKDEAYVSERIADVGSMKA